MGLSTPAALLGLGVLGLVLGVCAALALVRGLLERSAERLARRWWEEDVAEKATESVSRSRAVLRGQLVEHLAPIFEVETFPDPGDARFLGRPVDFIVFDGYGDVRVGRAERLREIVFVDVKTGGARLSAIERAVRDCVEEGRVRVAEMDRPLRVAE